MSFKDYDPKLFKKKRLVCELTQAELADICKITRKTLGCIESGKTIPHRETCIRIGVALDAIAYVRGFTRIFERLE